MRYHEQSLHKISVLDWYPQFSIHAYQPVFTWCYWSIAAKSLLAPLHGC